MTVKLPNILEGISGSLVKWNLRLYKFTQLLSIQLLSVTYREAYSYLLQVYVLLDMVVVSGDSLALIDFCKKDPTFSVT